MTTVGEARASTAGVQPEPTARTDRRRASLQALWVEGRRIDDPQVVRAIAFAVLNPVPPAAGLPARIRANRPIVPFADPDALAISRRLGYLVTLARGPVTTAEAASGRNMTMVPPQGQPDPARA